MTEIRTLQDYLNWNAQFGHWNYIFRGVSNDGHEMEPSACRRLKNKARDLSRDKLLEINEDLLERARQQGHGKDMTDLDLLAKLQHFGAATCFLDYTSNALVALYFACKENNSDTNGKVCAMCITVERHPEIVLKEVKQEISRENIDYFFETDDSGKPVIYFWKPDYQQNIRMQAQQSVLVFGDIVIPTLSECIILNDNKKSIIGGLKKLSNIDEEHLFPDFEGFASNNSQEKEYSEFGYEEYMQFASREGGCATTERLLGHSDKAREHYSKAVEHYSKAEICNSKVENTGLRLLNFCRIRYERGRLHLYNSEFGLAIEDCNYLIENPIEIYEEDSSPYWIRGESRFELGDYEGSVRDLHQAIKIYPAHGNAIRCLWKLRKKLDQYNEAIDDFNKVLEIIPDYIDVLLMRGEAKMQINQHNEAIDDFDKALEVIPDSVDALFIRGEAKMQINQNSDAKFDFQKALEIAIRDNNTEYQEKCSEKLNATI